MYLGKPEVKGTGNLKKQTSIVWIIICNDSSLLIFNIVENKLKPRLVSSYTQRSEILFIEIKDVYKLLKSLAEINQANSL